MQPQNPYIDNGHDPYAFIMNPAPAPKKKPLGLDPFIMRIILMVLSAFIVMGIIAVVLTLLSPKTTNTVDLIGLAQTQNEIIRISTKGTTDSVQQTTKNLAITTQYSLKTQQTQLLTVIGQRGTKLKVKDLALKQNASYDQRLQTSKQTSNFDLTYSQITEQQLKDYASTLKSLYAKTTKQTEKDLLSSSYSQVQLLLSQIPYTQQNIQAATQ